MTFCLTDPPYGIGASLVSDRNSSNLAKSKDYGDDPWDVEPPTDNDIAWIRSFASLQCIFGGNYFGLPATKCWLVWDKINSGGRADCELAWTNFPMAVRQFRYMWNGMLKEKPEARFHPTQKPLALMKWVLSLVPDVKSVLDPYSGSGTTLVAAKHMGLTAVGCEREERYCEIAAKRLAQEVLF